MPFCPEQHILLLLASDSGLEVLQYELNASNCPGSVFKFSVLDGDVGAPNFLDTEPLPL